MIINFKIFEKIDQSILDDFLYKYEKYKRDYKHSYEDTRDSIFKKALRYNVPIEFYDEVEILYYLYLGSHNLADPLNNNIKKNVKKYVLNSILKKIDDNPDLYYKLKKTLTVPMDNIYDLTLKYVFFLFHAVIKRSTKFMSDINKYNL